ncbi:MAG TPA: hypothetical protein VNW95_05730 [Mucilaginibacter sp.]|jgi:hypothetical protein|nr:hypothetical protein [Mucilaginibacter sp.]
MKKNGLILKLAILFNFVALLAIAQVPAGNINQLISKIDAHNGAMPVEKVFLQFDKPYYSTGDTIWFKGYLMDEAIKYSMLSSRLYIELLNDSNAVVKRFVFPASLGLTWGSIPLSQAYVHDGTYTIRAYTNWMRNFGDDYFFKQSFYFSNPDDHTWLVNVQSSLANDGNNVKLAMKFTGTDGKTGSNDLQLKVVNNKKVLLRNEEQTGPDGILDADFTLPAQTKLKNLNIVVRDKNDKTRSALIPIKANRPQDVDIQLMPEGGTLVAGIPSRIGFKAIGEDGKSIDIQGTVYDNDHNEVAQINTSHYGMGTFDIASLPDKTYTADITLPDGGKKTVPFPLPLKSGSVLNVRNAMDGDTIAVSVFNTADQAAGNKYYLVALSRGVVCYGASFTFSNSHFSTKVPKSLFPTGIAHFILLNAAWQPLNERVTFIDHLDNLQIELKTGADAFAARDSIPVHITVKDGAGQPMVGSFSMAITDDSQVKTAGAISENIVSNLLLTSDLKGYIEDPAFYLQHTAQSWNALDALLLTQGWVGYDLGKIGIPVKPLYEPEMEFTVKGTITNLFNQPVNNSKVMLISMGDQKFEKDTVTNKSGRFEFNGFPRIGKSTFVISATNARGKVINGGISIDEKNKLPVSSGSMLLIDPWNVNADGVVLNYVKLNKDYHAALDKAQSYGSGQMLKTVVIKDRAMVKNSRNLNGSGVADQVIGEDELVNAGKASLLDVINSKVKNFHAGIHNSKGENMNMEYYIREKRVHFVFDGIDVDRFYQPMGGQQNEHYLYQKQYLDYVSAEDVLGIEVIFNQNGSYNAASLTDVGDLLAANATGPIGTDIAYLEITTRSGAGPFIQRANGIYIYKPLELADYKQFYRPRYPVKGNVNNTDLRSTIHWSPNIITDKKGTATISFYAADKPTNYTIICEGSDMNGKVGVQTARITINGTKK